MEDFIITIYAIIFDYITILPTFTFVFCLLKPLSPSRRISVSNYTLFIINNSITRTYTTKLQVIFVSLQLVKLNTISIRACIYNYVIIIQHNIIMATQVVYYKNYEDCVRSSWHFVVWREVKTANEGERRRDEDIQ